jgi:hypothetical protein
LTESRQRELRCEKGAEVSPRKRERSEGREEATKRAGAGPGMGSPSVRFALSLPSRFRGEESEAFRIAAEGRRRKENQPTTQSAPDRVWQTDKKLAEGYCANDRGGIIINVSLNRRQTVHQ